MAKSTMEVTPLKISLQSMAKRVTKNKHIVTNEGAKRLQKYIQREIDINGHNKATNERNTDTLRSINRGGIHKRKTGLGSYEVYMKAPYATYVEFGTSRGIVGSHYFAHAINKFERAYAHLDKQIIEYFLQ